MKSSLNFSLVPLLLHALTSQAALTVTNIAAGNGANHSLFITSDGSLWTMGKTNTANLATAHLTTPIGLNESWSAALRRSREVVTVCLSNPTAACGEWAGIINGQLGDGHPVTSPPYGIALPEQVLASGVTAVSAGGQHSLTIKTDGSLWAMGTIVSDNWATAAHTTTPPTGRNKSPKRRGNFRWIFP